MHWAHTYKYSNHTHTHMTDYGVSLLMTAVTFDGVRQHFCVCAMKIIVFN